MKSPAGLIALAFGATVLLAPAAHAQISNLPPEVAAKIASIGPVLNPPMIAATIDLLKPLVKPVDGDLRVAVDLFYGPDQRNRLDVYTPVQRPSSAPVIVFVHGGGYVRGDKNAYGVIYGNVPAYFARHGMVAVNATYRLAPQHPWPAGAEDVGKVVAWLKVHASEYGGDPNRIILIGHSAGATHVASYVFDPALHPAGGAGVVGTALVSGVYRITKADLSAANNVAYFGKDESKLPARSPITHVDSGKVPLFLALSEFDPPYLATPTLELAEAVCHRDGKCPRLIWLKGHNHISEVASIDTADHELSDALLGWITALR